MCQKCVSPKKRAAIDLVESLGGDFADGAFLALCEERDVTPEDLEAFHRDHESDPSLIPQEEITMNDITKAEAAIDRVAQGIAPMADRGRQLAVDLTFPRNPELPGAIEKARADYEETDRIMNEVHRAWKHGEEQRLEFTKPLNEVLDKINAIFKPRLDNLDRLKKALRNRMSVFSYDELAWKRAEEARKRKDIEDKALREAGGAQALGMPKIADKILDQGAAAAARTTVAGATDLAASSKTIKWKARIADLPRFLRAVADGKVDASYVSVDVVSLSRMAHNLKGKLPAGFEGVETFEDVQIGARS